MYLDFYGFRQKPFNLVADPGFLYMSSKHRLALTYLEYGLTDGIGFVLLTGEIGTGKTTLMNKVGEAFVAGPQSVLPHPFKAAIWISAIRTALTGLLSGPAIRIFWWRW